MDGKDQDAYDEKEPTWQDWPGNDLVVSQTFSDVDNWYMFQGVPHVAVDSSNSVSDKLPLNHHRARYADPGIGRWGTRDPLDYDRRLSRSERVAKSTLEICQPRQIDTRSNDRVYVYLQDSPEVYSDPSGTSILECYSAYDNCAYGLPCGYNYIGCGLDCLDRYDPTDPQFHQCNDWCYYKYQACKYTVCGYIFVDCLSYHAISWVVLIRRLL
ncbi:MAG: hypothetical protein U1A27_01070 [Phycisphaerae bacterium]